MDVNHITIPDNIAAWVGLVCLLLLWKAVGVWLTDFIRNKNMRRRIGNRGSDDAHGSHGTEWYDRLIDSMNQNASINRQVAENLAFQTARLEAILEAFKLTQVEQRETNERIRRLQTVFETRFPQEA